MEQNESTGITEYEPSDIFHMYSIHVNLFHALLKFPETLTCGSFETFKPLYKTV